jgi:uncharacterized protein
MDGGKRLGTKPLGARTDLRIVDVDVHVNDTPQAIAPYCDKPWRLSLEALGKAPQRYLDISGFTPNLHLDPPIPGGAPHRNVHTAEEMRAELDQLLVDDAILLPDNLLRFGVLPNAEYATALCQAYNRWLMAEWVGNGLHAAIMACPQNPEDSAATIRAYAGTPGVVAVFLPTAGVSPLWGHRKYDPIYIAAQETGLPVLLHSVGMVSPAFPFNTDQFENNWGRHILQHPLAMMTNLTSMMHTGMPARFPDLKIVFTEAGIAWVPMMMWRMDRNHAEYRRVVPFLKERPSDYIKRQMWFCTQPYEEPQIAQQFIETMLMYDGVDRTLFASDWPHHDFDHPQSILSLPMSVEQRRKVMGENAVKLFKLPALARTKADAVR